MNNLSLADLQTALQQYLLDQTNNIDEQKTNVFTINDFTMETPNFSRAERLGIYHEAYRLRLIDALRNDFPALELALGKDIFSQVVSEYIDVHPSQHPSLRWLGEKLPEFLRMHDEWKNQPAIYELADFEWAQATAFDAANTDLATLDDVRALQNTQWLSLQLEFQPALQLISCYTNASEIWNALIKDETRIDTQIEIESQDWLIWRDDLQVVYRAISKPESWCLQTFKDNKTFSDVCEGLCEWFPAEEVPMKAAQYLQQWLHNGLIAKVIAEENIA